MHMGNSRTEMSSTMSDMLQSMRDPIVYVLRDLLFESYI